MVEKLCVCATFVVYHRVEGSAKQEVGINEQGYTIKFATKKICGCNHTQVNRVRQYQVLLNL